MRAKKRVGEYRAPCIAPSATIERSRGSKKAQAKQAKRGRPARRGTRSGDEGPWKGRHVSAFAAAI